LGFWLERTLASAGVLIPCDIELVVHCQCNIGRIFTGVEIRDEHKRRVLFTEGVLGSADNKKLPLR